MSSACQKEATGPGEVSAAEKAAEQKLAVDKALATQAAAQKAAAEKAAAEKVAAEKVAAEKVAAEQVAAEKFAAEKSAAEKAAAAKAVAEKEAADKAAAEAAAAQAKAEASSLPAGLVEAKAELAGALAQIDVTMARLEALSVATGDLKKPSKNALESISSVEGEMEALEARGAEMRDRGAAYFEAWETQLEKMSTPEVVAMATKRKDELAAKYAEVLTTMQESRSALDAYWGDMQLIRETIDSELTPEKQTTLAQQVEAAEEKAAVLRSRVEVTSAKLNQVSLLYTKP